MEKRNTVKISIFGHEVGKVSYDVNRNLSAFQYNPSFLNSGMYSRIFPYIIKRIDQIQLFKRYNSESFKGLPPMIADSLPDMFGNIIFQEWFRSKGIPYNKITPVELLTYVSNRGMGALEYAPAKELPKAGKIDIEEISMVLKEVMELKHATQQPALNDLMLLNVFKIGTSAGGALPKILISEDKQTGQIIPGDLEISDRYNHLLVKLYLEDESKYNRLQVEYVYYLIARSVGVEMMESKLIGNKHFATTRFDRINGEKKHVLTATGLTGYDFIDSTYSSYETLFQLSVDLGIPHSDIEQLFRRMVFNVVFSNYDDHLKNHSFIYNDKRNTWNLAPAYDVTFPFNVYNMHLTVKRALSINEKRVDIGLEDVMKLADEFTIKNPKKIIKEIQSGMSKWDELCSSILGDSYVQDEIKSFFTKLI